MKSTTILTLLTALVYTQAHPDFSKLTTKPIGPDSVLVSGYLDVPAQIPVRVKLPARQSYRAGQRIFCSPYYTIASGRMGNLFVSNPHGSFPVVLVK